MGISFKKREDDMKILSIPLLLPSLLAAEVLQRILEIQEHGTSYTQTVTFDFDRKVQIIDVPAHNNIVQSRTIFDFNQGMMVEAQPWVKHCYLKEIPENMATMDQMIKGLSKRGQAPINAATAPVSEKHFSKFQEIKLDVLANDEMMKECENYKIFRVSEVDPALPKRSPEVSRMPVHGWLDGDRVAGDCFFPGECVWQTCTYGTDSCYWTVSCPPTPTGESANCDDVIHNSNFHGPDGAPIKCEPCFNTQCEKYNCKYSWENGCQLPEEQGGISNRLPECSNDADLGNDCGASRCVDPNTLDAETFKGNHCPTGTAMFDCKQDYDHMGYVLAGHMCLLNCGDVSCGAVMC